MKGKEEELERRALTDKVVDHHCLPDKCRDHLSENQRKFHPLVYRANAYNLAVWVILLLSNCQL